MVQRKKKIQNKSFRICTVEKLIEKKNVAAVVQVVTVGSVNNIKKVKLQKWFRE
jgi:hypothetical protein